MDAERKRVADAVADAREDVELAYWGEDYGHYLKWIKVFEAAVREDERWELMARSEAEPT
jgi:hypothetical protein